MNCRYSDDKDAYQVNDRILQSIESWISEHDAIEKWADPAQSQEIVVDIVGNICVHMNW